MLFDGPKGSIVVEGRARIWPADLEIRELGQQEARYGSMDCLGLVADNR
jgi:hypothetical protein